VPYASMLAVPTRLQHITLPTTLVAAGPSRVALNCVSNQELLACRVAFA